MGAREVRPHALLSQSAIRFRQVLVSPTSYTIKVDCSVAGGSWTVIEEGKATNVK